MNSDPQATTSTALDEAEDQTRAEPRVVIVTGQPPKPASSQHDIDHEDFTGDPDAGDAAPPEVEAVPPPPSTRIIALINQKGGVGKTTSTVNLGAALSHLGMRVLLIDLDPQAHLTLHLGVDPGELELSNYDLLVDDSVKAIDVVRQVQDNLWVLPAEVNLAGAETELGPKLITGRAQRVLKDKLEPLLGARDGGTKGRRNEGNESANPQSAIRDPQSQTPDSGLRTQDAGPRFDYILIDCPPSLGLLTINALSFAREVFVPMQAHFLALQGLSKLLETVGFIRQGFNPQLVVSGVILCMHEKQTLLAAEVTRDLKSFLEGSRDQDVPWRDAVMHTPMIRRNIKLAESPSFGATIFEYAPDSNGAEDYRALALSVAKQSVNVGR
ncbi:MAG: AAA family ATPase [Phycisphaeraceae bacterium]